MAREMLDPKTPREYLEACHRLVETFEKFWDELPDGDGDKGSPDDENQTKTDMFMILAGCADFGKELIKNNNKMRDLINSI